MTRPRGRSTFVTARLRDLRLAAVDLAVLVRALSRGGEGGVTFESHEEVARGLRLSHDSVRRSRARLVGLGLLVVEEPGTGRGHPNVYRIAPTDKYPSPRVVDAAYTRRGARKGAESTPSRRRKGVHDSHERSAQGNPLAEKGVHDPQERGAVVGAEDTHQRRNPHTKEETHQREGSARANGSPSLDEVSPSPEPEPCVTAPPVSLDAPPSEGDETPGIASSQLSGIAAPETPPADVSGIVAPETPSGRSSRTAPTAYGAAGATRGESDDQERSSRPRPSRQRRRLAARRARCAESTTRFRRWSRAHSPSPSSGERRRRGLSSRRRWLRQATCSPMASRRMRWSGGSARHGSAREPTSRTTRAPTSGSTPRTASAGGRGLT